MAGSTGECIVARCLHRWQLLLLSGGVSAGGWHGVWQCCFWWQNDSTVRFTTSLAVFRFVSLYWEVYHGVKHILTRNYSIGGGTVYQLWLYAKKHFIVLSFLNNPPHMCSYIPLSCLRFFVISILQSVMNKHSPLLPPAVWIMTQQQPFFSVSEVILSGRPFCCAWRSNITEGMERLFNSVYSFLADGVTSATLMFPMKQIGQEQGNWERDGEICRMTNFLKFVLHSIRSDLCSTLNICS